MYFARTSGFVISIAASLMLSQSANAAFILVDDFETYTVGNFNAGGTTGEVDQGGPWIARDGAGNIAGSGLIAVQNDGTTKHLAYGWNAGIRAAYRPVTPIADGDSASYYFQIRSLDATPDMSYGLSDAAVATNAGFGDFEAQVALVDDGDAVNNLFKLVGRNGATLVDLATGLATNTWYDVWLVINNATDTYNVYFATNGGDPNTLGALVGANLGFRNGLAANNLVTFMTLDAPASNPTDSGAHLDDIYYNSNAVPEPTSLLLAAIAVGLCGASRRRL